MSCLFLDVQIKSFYSASHHRITASSKPRLDAISIANQCGFKSKIFYWIESATNCLLKKHPNFPNRLLRWQTSLFARFTKGAVIMVQIPFLWRNMHDVIRKLSLRNNLIILVHDVDAVRGSKYANDDIQTLNYADVIICHTPEMVIELRRLGVKSLCVNLKFFDYLNSYNKKSVYVNQCHPNILYAGNLEKSPFVNQIDKIKNSDLMTFSIYGRGGINVDSPFINYRGTFDSNVIGTVVGDWGLVWDGDSVESCTGIMGNYLRYNSPFKFSLYLAIGIPVIVWSQSAMAQYVKKYHLGICVESLSDVYDRIQELSAQDIQNIKIGISTYSKEVKSGTMLKSAIEQALAIMDYGK